MSFLKSLPPDATLLNVFKMFPAMAKPLIEYHEILLRGPSPLTVAERELIAGYVSGLNACNYCHGVHEATTCALFNFMNRFVEGHGIKASPEYFPVSAKRLHDSGYSGLLRMLGL